MEHYYIECCFDYHYFDDNGSSHGIISSTHNVYFDSGIFGNLAKLADLCKDGFDSEMVSIKVIEIGIPSVARVESYFPPDMTVPICGFKEDIPLWKAIVRFINRCPFRIGHIESSKERPLYLNYILENQFNPAWWEKGEVQ